MGCSGILSAERSSSCWQLHQAEGSVKRTLEGKGRYENPNVRHGSDSRWVILSHAYEHLLIAFQPRLLSACIIPSLYLCVHTGKAYCTQ